MNSVEILYEMESELIANITRLLAQDLEPSAEWQEKKLAQLGTLRKDNDETVKNYLPKAMEEAKSEIREAGLAASLSGDASPALVQVWTIWENKTMNQYRNLGMTLINSAQETYVATVYAQTAQVLLGSQSLRQAITRTASGWASQGLKSFMDKAGRNWSTEAYAQVVLRSNIRQVTTETTLAGCDELGVDLVEVSSHIGARPGCSPYQGKVYSKSGLNPNYPALSSTSMGKAAGLFGCNCGHQMYPYYKGTKKTFDKYPEKENKKVYAESQKQRYLERQIRAAKRELAVAESLKNKIAVNNAQTRISARQAKMREFIDETDRARRRDREQVPK